MRPSSHVRLLADSASSKRTNSATSPTNEALRDAPVPSSSAGIIAPALGAAATALPFWYKVTKCVAAEYTTVTTKGTYAGGRGAVLAATAGAMPPPLPNDRCELPLAVGPTTASWWSTDGALPNTACMVELDICASSCSSRTTEKSACTGNTDDCACKNVEPLKRTAGSAPMAFSTSAG